MSSGFFLLFVHINLSKIFYWDLKCLEPHTLHAGLRKENATKTHRGRLDETRGCNILWNLWTLVILDLFKIAASEEYKPNTTVNKVMQRVWGNRNTRLGGWTTHNRLHFDHLLKRILNVHIFTDRTFRFYEVCHKSTFCLVFTHYLIAAFLIRFI